MRNPPWLVGAILMDVNEGGLPAEGICPRRGNDQARRQGADQIQKI